MEQKQNIIIFKVAVLVMGVIAIGVGGHAYDQSFINELIRLSEKLGAEEGVPSLAKEKAFIGLVSTCLIISLASLVLTLMKINESTLNTLDAVYHGLAFILVLTGGALMIASGVKFHKDGCNEIPNCQYYGEKWVAGIISIINGFVYAVTCFILFK